MVACGLVLALAGAALPAAANKPKPSTASSSALTLVGETGDDRRASDLDQAFFTALAFRGEYAFQGTWEGGFRVTDVSKPWRPKPVAEVDCGSREGDIGVYGDLVFRSVDTPVAATTVEETCDAQPATPGFEGIQIFRVKKPWRASARDLVAAVATDCGSHTHTVVPDPRHGRVLLYVSSGKPSPAYDNDPVWRHECAPDADKFQIVAVPLDRPEKAEVVADVPLDGAEYCHDIAVLLAKRPRLAACAGETGVLFRLRNLVEPEPLRSLAAEGVPRWHTAAFSRSGKVTALAWEPDGGFTARCEPGDPQAGRTVYLFATWSGKLLGRWVLPRTQSAQENCAIASLATIPSRTRDLLTVGAFQAGTYVVDFGDPARPKTVAWHDPAALDPAELSFGGTWGSFWYRGFVYASDVTRGLDVFRLEDRSVKAKAVKVDFLNPQTLIWEQPAKKKRKQHKHS